MPLTTVSQIGDEPISLDELKRYLKIDVNDTTEDDILLDLIKSAREQAEKYTRRGLVQAQLSFTTPQRTRSTVTSYATFIELPRPPFIRLTTDEAGFAVYSTDDLGTSTGLASGQYTLDNSFEPVRLCTQAGTGNKVSATYEAGYLTTLSSNGVFTVTGESAAQLTDINITGMSTANTDYFKLYWAVSTSVNTTTRTLNLYKAVSKAATALVAHGTVENSGVITLAADNTSGIGGTINLAYIQDESDPNDIIISGITTTSRVPSAIRNAILMMAGFFFENRMPTEMPPGAKKLMDPYRILTI